MSEPSPIILSSPDGGSRTAGEAIKRARESQGMTLEALAAMIKVTPAKLEALEQGRYDQLPDANFTRALAMTLCRALKVDASEVLAGLPAAKPAPLAEGKPPLNQPFKEARARAPLFDQSTIALPMLLTPKFLAPAVLLIAAWVIYMLPDSVVLPDWLSASRAPETTQPAGVGQVVVPVPLPDAASAQQSVPAASDASLLKLDSAMPPGSATVPTATTATTAATATNAATTAEVPAGAAVMTPSLQRQPATSTAPSIPQTPTPAQATSATKSLPTAPVATSPPSSSTLTIAVSRPSWIEVKDAQGARLFSRLAQAGENLTLNGTAPLQVRIGNVSGIQAHFKGQPVDLSSFTRNNVARLELK